MAEEREGRRRARDIACRDPILVPSSTVAACPFVDTSSIDGGGGGGGASSCCVCVSDVERTGMGGKVCEAWTSQGSHPPGPWVIFAFSRPRRRGMEGPVRSMSRIPTEWPACDNESASWVVIEDLPTPPLPERTCNL